MLKAIFISPIVVLCCCLSDWGTYKPDSLFSLSQLSTGASVQLGIIKEIDDEPNQQDIITQEAESIKSTYLMHDAQSIIHKRIEIDDGLIEAKSLVSQGIQLSISINSSRNHTYFILSTGDSLTYKYNHEECSEQLIELTDIRDVLSKIMDFQQIESGKNTLLRCRQTKYINISLAEDFDQLWFEKSAIFEQKATKFMNFHRIPQSATFTEMTQYAISTTLSKITTYDSLNGKILGFQDPLTGDYEVKYSMLVIDLLSKFDNNIAQELMNNSIEYLEDKLIYGEESLSQIPIPQHTEAFLKFQNQKSLKVLDGLVFHTIFQRVNRVIGKQDDYMATKKIHPILLTMLQVKWQSQFKYLASSSIYTESFLYDVLINKQGEEQDVSLSKLAWLVKTLNVLKVINKQQLNKVELSSLLQLLTNYMKDELLEKKNSIFLSIITAGRNRYYTGAIAIESTLPHVYQLVSKADKSYLGTIQMLNNLTRQHGVISQEGQGQFIRGNVIPYFNLKILRMLQREENIDRNAVRESMRAKSNNLEKDVDDFFNVMGEIQLYSASMHKRIKTALMTKVMSDWIRHKKMFGHWSGKGETYQPDSFTVLINIVAAG